MAFTFPRRPLSRRRSRPAVAALASVTVLAAVAACAPASTSAAPAATTDSASKDFTIYWNPGHSYDAYKKVIDAFGQEHGLTINWQKFQWPDMTTKLVADFRAGKAPDLAEVSTGPTAVQYGIKGDARDLTSFIQKDAALKFPSDYQSAAVDSVQYQGKTYGIPFHLTANGLLFYNKKMLKDAGFDAPPTTWEEMLKIAKATTKGNTYGIALNSDPSYGLPWLLQNGVTVNNASTKEFLQPEDKAAEAMQFLQDLVFKEKVAPKPVATNDYAGPQKVFTSGRAAMFVSGPWDLLPVKKGAGSIDWGVAPPLKDSVQASLLTGTALMIPTKSQHPNLAWQLLTKLAALDTELAATQEAGMAMPRKSWASSPAVSSDPNLSVVAKSLEVAGGVDVALAASGAGSEVNDLWKATYQAIVIQDKPVADVLKNYRDQAKVALQ